MALERILKELKDLHKDPPTTGEEAQEEAPAQQQDNDAGKLIIREKKRRMVVEILPLKVLSTVRQSDQKRIRSKRRNSLAAKENEQKRIRSKRRRNNLAAKEKFKNQNLEFSRESHYYAKSKKQIYMDWDLRFVQ
ncbi:hypothetical protein S245_005488, partial [Arachis hypogaea]